MAASTSCESLNQNNNRTMFPFVALYCPADYPMIHLVFCSTCEPNTGSKGFALRSSHRINSAVIMGSGVVDYVVVYVLGHV